tara:strand:+ start:268 stop:1056 length:789 start_codon:yes stop_codon:yes gene_type:complete
MSSITFDNAFEEYFKLKKKYMKKYNKEKDKISKLTQLNNDEKLEKLKKNIFCIKCKQLGGTLFEEKNNLLIAKCKAINPCSLDIQLERAIFKNVNNKIDELENKIIDIKQKTILTKLNYLFTINSNQDTQTEFDLIKKEFINLTNIYDKYLKYLDNIVNNFDEKEIIKELNKTLNENIKQIKDNFCEFENTNNVILIKDSIELHVNTIIPLVKKITKITYPINYIHTDEDNNLNYLIQNTYEISKLDIKINNTENKIIIFNI